MNMKNEIPGSISVRGGSLILSANAVEGLLVDANRWRFLLKAATVADSPQRQHMEAMDEAEGLPADEASEAEHFAFFIQHIDKGIEKFGV